MVVVLSGRNCNRVPSQQEKAALLANGFGDKPVFFPAHGSAYDLRTELLGHVCQVQLNLAMLYMSEIMSINTQTRFSFCIKIHTQN